MLDIIAASVVFLGTLAFPQDQEIPPLTQEIVVELLRFELPDVDPALISVLKVDQLDELGRASVRVGSVEAELRLQCHLTDFGPKWRLAESLPTELKNPERPKPPAEKPKEEKQDIPEELSDAEESTPSTSYKNFLSKLFEDVIAEAEENYAGFYFHDDDFDIGAVANGGDPVQQLADKRAEFIRQCVQLSLQLSGAERFNTISFFATRSSAKERAELRALMPQARRYIKAVSVEIIVDGRLGTIVFEGLTLMPDGWRVGSIASVEIASETKAEPPQPEE